MDLDFVVLLDIFMTQLGRLSVHGSDYGDAKFIDIGHHPKDLNLALNCPEFTLWTTDRGVILLRGTKVVYTIDLGFTVTASAVSPEGDEAIIGEQNGKLHIYSFSGVTLHEVAPLEKHRGAISVIQYSPDLSMFASADLNIEDDV